MMPRKLGVHHTHNVLNTNRPLWQQNSAHSTPEDAMQHKPCTVLEPPEAPAKPGYVPCRCQVLHLLSRSSTLWDSPPAPPWYSTQVLSRDKGKASPGFYFNVKCWECLMTGSQMRWGLRFLLGEQHLGNSIPLWCYPLARSISALFTSQAMPGFLLCCVCVVICTRETPLWTNPENNLVAVRGVPSLDCISGHLLLTSLGIFTPLGSKDGLCMKYLLKNPQV